ncbi:ATP-grasp domain-containing protein [Parabacteroides goldsteinii]|uniref:ATP-grasp domain-containing protein n=1 Tax=Parabacteroides goldsteinii TaxID=328812 RepID=UPI003AB5A76F
MNILFTCVGRRTYLLKYFREQLNSGDLIIATDMQLSAPALSAADIVVQVPDVYAEDYIDRTLAICQKYSIDVLISLNDLELPIIAATRKRFWSIGVNLIVSSEEVIAICFDKYRTANYILSLGLKTPKTFIDYNKAIESIGKGKLAFPLVLKPRWGSGSIGIEFVNDLNEMKVIYDLLQKKIEKTILSKASQNDDNILIQEKIIGPEYGVDIMNDLQGNNIAVSVKKKLAMRAGETDKAITVNNEKIRNIGSLIGTNLGHVGNLDCDILEMDGEYYVLELNPRFGGGYPFSHEAGVNMPKAIIRWIKGEKVDSAILQPIYGKMFAKCDYLVEIKSK